MNNCLIGLKNKAAAFRDYLFPEDYTISLHHSTININTLFFIRLGSLLYLTGIYLWSFTLTRSLLNNIIYLTMQGYFLTWLFFLLTMQDYLINGFGKWGRVFPLANNLKYYIEIIYEVAFCIELPITIIFWGFLFKILLNMEGVSTEIIINNANLHAGPMICLSLDMIYNTFKFPKSHFVVVLMFMLNYGLINLVYSLVVHVIYKPIDWKSVLSYVLMFSTLVMCYFMHWLGRTIYEKLKKKGLIDENRKQSNDHDHDHEYESHNENESNQAVGAQECAGHQNEELNSSVITDDL